VADETIMFITSHLFVYMFVNNGFQTKHSFILHRNLTTDCSQLFKFNIPQQEI